MKLLVHDLITSLSQYVTTDHRVKQVVHIKPHLYRQGSPAGSVTLSLQDEDGNTIATGDTRSIAGIGSGTYWHGYADFELSAQLAANTTYKVVLTASGYAFDAGAYLGWVNGFDLGKYEATYTPSNWFSAPMDLEVWTRSQPKRGIA